MLACFVLATCAWGFGFYGHGVFLAELQRQHGWSTSLISGATTAYYLVGGVLVAFTADGIARVGPRRFVLAAAATLGLSAALIPQVQTPWQLYAVYILMAAGWAGTSLAAIVTVLGLWFDKRRGLAMSLALNGASAGSVVVVPLLVGMTAWLGFRAAVAASVLLFALLLVPMVLAWVDRPSAAWAPPSADAVEAPWSKGRILGDIGFWSMAVPFSLGIAAQAGFLMHQYAALEPILGNVNTGFAVALTGAFAIIGRVGLGFFIDRVSPRGAAALLLLLHAAALAAIAHTRSPAVLYAACAAYGLGVGNIITLPPLVIQREFPAAQFATIASLATAVAGLTYAFGPAALGLLRDASGAYVVPLLFCAGVDVLAAVLVLWRPRAAARP
ncbi:MAG: MFS transporter [Burkholderiales bacterium]|nr:MFS transporter [Burkholderiales bacterium]